MKQAILFSALVLAAANLATINTAEAAPTFEKCKEIKELGGTIMKTRQLGVPMSDALELAQSNEAVVWIVEQAYLIPRYHTPQVREEAIEDHKERTFAQCYRYVVKK